MPRRKPIKKEAEKLKVLMNELEEKNRYISELLETKMVLERRVKELLARHPLSEKEDYEQRLKEDREIELSLIKELDVMSTEIAKKFDDLKKDVEKFRTKFRELENRHNEVENNYEKLISLLKKES